MHSFYDSNLVTYTEKKQLYGDTKAHPLVKEKKKEFQKKFKWELHDFKLHY